MEPTDSILHIVQTGGVTGLLLVIILGGIRRWWVFGWIYKESEERCEMVAKERDEWKALALRSTNLAESLSELQKYKGAL